MDSSSEPRSQSANQSTAQAPKLALVALAAFMLLCGFCSCALYVIIPFTDPSATRLETSTVLGATAGFGSFFAAILAWQGLKRISIPAARNFPPARVLALAFLGAILLGTAVLSFKSIAPFVFPPFHFLAATLIPLTFIAYAARRLGGMSGIRELVTYFSWGALGATFLALIAELVTAGLLILVVAVALSLAPDGRVTLERLAAQLRLAQNGDPTLAMNQLLANPIVAMAVLIYFAVIVPPLEEALKTLGLVFISRERTRIADAVLWGISAGAGFAALENLFNATGLLSAWAFGMFLRVGATTMHVANGALMGRGWYAARVEKKWGRLGIAYGASVLFHMLWNAAVILLSQRAAGFDFNPGIAVEKLLAQGALVLSLAGGIMILSVLGLVWIVYAVRSAKQNLMES